MSKRYWLWGGCSMLGIYLVIGLPFFFGALSCGAIGDDCNAGYEFLIVNIPAFIIGSIITNRFFNNSDTAWLIATLVSSSILYFYIGTVIGRIYKYFKDKQTATR